VIADEAVMEKREVEDARPADHHEVAVNGLRDWRVIDPELGVAKVNP